MARHQHSISSSPQIRKPSLFPHPTTRRLPSILSIHASILPLLRTLVLVVVAYAEYWEWSWETSGCHFPSLSPAPDTSDDDDEDEDGAPKPPRTTSNDGTFRILMAADPQLIDMRSYPGRNWVSRKLGVWFTDAYLRKSWRFVIKSEEEHGGGGVDAVVWLGDLLDSGVESVDRSEHSHYVHRFHLLFPLPRSPSPQGSHSSLSPPIPTIYLPGNHDLGLHLPSSSLASYARERFTAAFGEVMGEKEWNGWSVVWVDSMGLLEQGEEGKEAREWVEDVGARPNTLPRILLTHIPLYRPADTSCGPAREHAGGIHEGSGRNYQTELDTVTSEWLLRTLGPTLVYS